MMDDAEQIPQPVDPKKKQCVDGEPQQHAPTLMLVVVSKVLDDDNLLIEILLRVGFPTTLVRAALVCKRWLHHASDHKFLSRFRKLHPPRLLGYYVSKGRGLVLSEQPDATRFVPMLPQPPELAAVIRRVESVRVGAHGKVCIMDCRNGNVLTRCFEGGMLSYAVHRPLCPERSMNILPPLPRAKDNAFATILTKKEEGGLSYLCLYLSQEFTIDTRKTVVHVYTLQDGVWRMHTSVTSQLHHPLTQPRPVVVGNKIYMASSCSDDIFVLDLTASSFSSIQLPQGVKYHLYSTTFSQADDASSVYLIHVPVKEFKLHIWLHKGDSWVLVDTICLHEMCASLGVPDHTLEDEDIEFPVICQVGDDAEVLFLRMCGCTFYLDVTSRTVRKLFQLGLEIYPFTMIWPPTFPALKDDPSRNTM